MEMRELNYFKKVDGYLRERYWMKPVLAGILMEHVLR